MQRNMQQAARQIQASNQFQPNQNQRNNGLIPNQNLQAQNSNTSQLVIFNQYKFKTANNNMRRATTPLVQQSQPSQSQVMKFQPQQFPPTSIPRPQFDNQYIPLQESETKIQALNQKIQSLVSDNEKLNKYGLQKTEELEQLRYKFVSLEQSKINPIKQQDTDILLNFLKQNNENQIASLNNKNQQLTQLNDCKAEENDILRQKNLRLEGQILEAQKLKLENRKLQESQEYKNKDQLDSITDQPQYQLLKGQVIELESDNQKMKTTLKAHIDEKESIRELLINQRNQYELEIQRLEQLFREKDSELDSKQIRFDQSFKELRLLQDDKMQMQRLLNLKEEESEDYRIKYTKIEKTISEFRGQENQNVQVFAEVERLRHQLVIKNEEIQQWMEEFKRISQQLEELRTKNSAQQIDNGEQVRLKNEIERLKKLENELYSLRISNQKMKDQNQTDLTSASFSQTQEIETLKKKIILLESTQKNPQDATSLLEIQKLTGINKSRLTEIEQWRFKYLQLEIQASDLQSYKERISLLETEIQSWIQKVNQLQASGSEKYSPEKYSNSQFGQNSRINTLMFDLRNQNKIFDDPPTPRLLDEIINRNYNYE